MARFVELRRHTDNDGDVLSGDGVAAALEVGAGLAGGYRVAVSTGAQRATQTVACLLAALGQPVPGGVVVEAGLRSGREDRWRELYQEAGSGELAAMRAVDPGFVAEEAAAPRGGPWPGASSGSGRASGPWSSVTARPTRRPCSGSPASWSPPWPRAPGCW